MKFIINGTAIHFSILIDQLIELLVFYRYISFQKSDGISSNNFNIEKSMILITYAISITILTLITILILLKILILIAIIIYVIILIITELNLNINK